MDSTCQVPLPIMRFDSTAEYVIHTYMGSCWGEQLLILRSIMYVGNNIA